MGNRHSHTKDSIVRRVIPNNENERQKLVVAALNTWTAESLAANTAFRIDKNTADRIMDVKFQSGGIFWNYEEVETALSDANITPTQVTDIICLGMEELNWDIDLFLFLSPQITSVSQIEPHVDGPDVLKSILDLISVAESYIHLSVMLFFNDETGSSE